ncbi:unnamed protein product [Cercopithifilaria johnstoni]|uniref:Uncharacterized protein n=1 Tax=Cercopithifilaria johnstoni TaxID=2874296 RepID=A0A8J2LNN6_9BILA|nr:unnamed protein product [Cercopithifilaria johnstoni]
MQSLRASVTEVSFKSRETGNYLDILRTEVLEMHGSMPARENTLANSPLLSFRSTVSKLPTNFPLTYSCGTVRMPPFLRLR